MTKAPPRKKGPVRRNSEIRAKTPQPVGAFPRTTVEQVYGCLAYDGPPATIEEMDEAVLREAIKHN